MTAAHDVAPVIVEPAARVSGRRRGMRRRLVPVMAGLVVVLLLAAGAVRWHGRTGAHGTAALDRSAQASARAFLASWVDADGRVVRRDQGGDTVSEGQAYGMLLAVAAGDRGRFDVIWAWTQTHLQQPNSLLAWRWVNGAVTDDQSAADADLDAIWALSLAGVRFGEPTATEAAKTMAAAVLAQETVTTSSGRLLAAGPWARADPVTVNPSYLVAGTAAALARFTADSRWNSLVAPTRTLDSSTIGPRLLPPDWVTVDRANAEPARPIGAPGGGGGVQYGLDAPRLLIRLAASCDPIDRRLAASAALVAKPGQAGIRSLDGQAQVTWQHPLSDVAAAAVQGAVGHSAAATAELDAAQALQGATPTYYGAAWVALGRTLLTTGLLTNCFRS